MRVGVRTRAERDTRDALLDDAATTAVAGAVARLLVPAVLAMAAWAATVLAVRLATDLAAG
jgi:hypothetical protein